MLDMGFLSNTTFTLDKNNETFNRFYLWFEIAMFIITIIFSPFVFILLHLIRKYPQFHINLVILIANMFISYGTLTISRQILFIQVYFCADEKDCYINELFMVKGAMFAEYIKFTSIVAYFVASNWIIIERIWAIINLKGYETKKDHKFIIGVIILQWILSAGGFWLAQEGYLPVMVFIFPGVVLTGASVLIYRYMDGKNKRKYRLSKSVGNAYTLTERYQLAENIKTAPLVLAMINVNITMNTMTFGAVIFMFYSSTVFYKQIGKLIFDFLLTFYAPAICISAIQSVRKWRNVCIGWFIKPMHKITPSNNNTVTCITNINNNNNSLITPQKLEADIYFEQLNNHWA